MSSSSTIVTDEHFAYLAARTSQDDQFLKELKLAAAAAGIPDIWISSEQAALMQILLRLHRATTAIEVGTLAGYSAIVMARAMPDDGRVTTIELEELHARFARDWIARSDVAEKIAVIQGPGRDVLADTPDRSADACFIDADKESYKLYLDEMRRILKPGGLIMVDNAFAFGQLFDDHPDDPSVPAVREFNEYLAAQDWVQSIIVPVGDGLWVGVTSDSKSR